MQGDKKLTTSTDEDGNAYSFRDLPDGIWTIEVELTGSSPRRHPEKSASLPEAPAPTWELKLMAPAMPTTTPATALVPGPAGGRGAPALTPAQAKARAAQQAAAQDQAQSRAAAVAATSGGGGDAVLSGSVGGGSGISAGNAVAGNQFNGNASFSLDNSALDAIPFSISGIREPKPAYAKGRVGLAFGGPLKIPHLLSGKNSTFTLNYNMGRTRNASTSNSNVPTSLERTGNFSQSMVQGPGGTLLPVTVYDPTSRTIPFRGNIIPGYRISSTALALVNYYPHPNAPDPNLNYPAVTHRRPTITTTSTRA